MSRRPPSGRRSFVERPFVARMSPGAEVLTVSGILDELSIADFREALRTALETSEGSLTVDLSDVDFLPSLAIGVLVGAWKSGADVILVAREGCVAARVLKLTGLPHTHRPMSKAAAEPERA